MNIFGVGLPEIAVIGAIALLVFGPKRLPELGKTLGKTLKGFQTASNEFEREIQKAMSDDETNESLNASFEKVEDSSDKDESSLKNNTQNQ